MANAPPLVWVEQVYTELEKDNADEALDILYENVEGMLLIDPSTVDTMLLSLDPTRLTSQGVLAILISTLGVRKSLSNRANFIDRSRAMLDSEEEGATAVLAGLE